MRTHDYQVTNHVGTLLYTSPDKELAKEWARRNALTFPGLVVEEVEHITVRRRIYAPRLRVVEAA